jgi:hypothetical protein
MLLMNTVKPAQRLIPKETVLDERHIIDTECSPPMLPIVVIGMYSPPSFPVVTSGVLCPSAGFSVRVFTHSRISGVEKRTALPSF